MNDPPVDGVCKIINLGKAESGDPSNPGLNTALLDIFHIKVSSLELEIILPPKNRNHCLFPVPELEGPEPTCFDKVSRRYNDCSSAHKAAAQVRDQSGGTDGDYIY